MIRIILGVTVDLEKSFFLETGYRLFLNNVKCVRGRHVGTFLP
jgi:hypothetical protein